MVTTTGTIRRVALLSALALLLPLLALAPSAGAEAGTAADPTPFSVHGSVHQLAITDAPPGATVDLHDSTGTTVATGTVDDFGSLLFRSLAEGAGYVVVLHDGGADTTGPPTTVLGPDDIPPQSFYDAQHLSPGFGYITTRDGTTLSATVHLPGPPEDGPYPTVIEYSGYDPSNPNAPQPSTLLAQSLGFATVGVNIRGTGCSGGSFFYFEEIESLDGYDVVETVAAQPWVLHGEPGMVGISYPGISQLFVGQTQPPHLAAIAPLSVIADTYRSTLYPGGIFNNGFALSWARGRVQDGRPYGQGWERGIVDAGGPNGEQCARNQQLRLQNPDLEQEIADHPYYETEQGDPLSPITFVDRIDVPVFLAGAWQDEQTGGHFPVMLDRFTSAPVRRFTITNGTHVESLMTNLQRWSEFLDLYVARRIPHVPAVVRALAPSVIQSATGASVPLPPDRFDDYDSYEAALAAYEAEQPVRVVFENGWGDPSQPGAPVGTFEADFSQWPPAETVPTRWYLQPDQVLAPSPPTVPDGDGKATTPYRYDPDALPQRTLPTGDPWATDPPYQWEPLPVGTGLAYDTEPLADDVVMVGSGSVDLWLRSTAPDTDVEVQLVEVRPDGQERFVQAGWLRASQRALDPAHSTELAPWHTHLAGDAADLPAGELTPVRVELFPFAHVFRAGSRLRLTIDAPGDSRPEWTFDALPGGDVVNEIGHSVHHASSVVLPVIPGIEAPASLPPCPSLRGQPCRTHYATATPVAVAAASTPAGVQVTWSAPPETRPGDVLAGYTVTESPDGATREVDPDATAATFADLAAGDHFFRVEARYDGGGTSGPSTGSNTVAVVPPDTRITSGPPPVTPRRTARFRFASDKDGATFRCALDREPEAACDTPDEVGPVRPGYHVFAARAVDPGGNADPSPAARVWFVDDVAARCHGPFPWFRPGCVRALVDRWVARFTVPILQRWVDAALARP